MGTNYYVRHDACKHCGRGSDETHICKSMTMFQGYEDHWLVGPIRSWADWKRVLTEEMDASEVWDEYGRSQPTGEFIAEVEATDQSYRRRQFDWMAEHYPNDVRAGSEWLDADGFSFTLSEFT